MSDVVRQSIKKKAFIWAVIMDNAFDIFFTYFLGVFGSPNQSRLKNY